ncbi:hypothetical protein BDB01DRAFT_731643 [Pilobolus umbonatus]|nr:hypothetical protein BDB01DRAFT_731643 [Pilobolus umbonatus]
MSMNPEDILSKIQISYTDDGIHLEARISNASELRSLIDAFGKMCCSDTTMIQKSDPPCQVTPTQKVVTSRLIHKKPINVFTHHRHPVDNSYSDLCTKQLKTITDMCVETFVDCWIKFNPIMNPSEFMTLYHAMPTKDTLIVNAICSYMFRHMVIHHPRPELDDFFRDEDKIQQQEDYYFSRARECLSQSFDTPDRYTLIALLLMSLQAAPSQRHHYLGMVASILHQLNIYPRMVDENIDDYNKEMDTRLWWFVWTIDFALWTSGDRKNTPQSRIPGEVDLPAIFEQDIDETEIGVITYIYCLHLWRIQSEIIATLTDPQSELTLDRMRDYDRRLLDFYDSLPDYLCFESGFQYGSEDLFLACLRVTTEYNATRIILHQLFIPDYSSSQTPTSLQSLNICLSTSLQQLNVIKTCTISGCVFDRDELWRAAQVISMAADMYHQSNKHDQSIMMKGITLNEFNLGLEKAYLILQSTREYAYPHTYQVADWIQVEIERHLCHQSYPIQSKITKKKPIAFQHAFSTPIMQFISADEQQQNKSQARFRYFNPSKVNKFLFIDEHPMI